MFFWGEMDSLGSMVCLTLGEMKNGPFCKVRLRINRYIIDFENRVKKGTKITFSTHFKLADSRSESFPIIANHSQSVLSCPGSF